MVITLSGGFIARDQFRTAIIVETFGPGLFHDRLRRQKLSVGSVQKIVKAVSVRPCEPLSHLPAERCIEKDGDLRRIPVVQIVRRELVMPLELSGVGIECNY